MNEFVDDLGRKIRTFDNIFPKSFHEEAYMFAKNSVYRIGDVDGPEPIERMHQQYMHSHWSLQDLKASGILDCLSKSEASKYIEGELVMAKVNLSSPADTHYLHTHRHNETSVLYYLNLDWKPEWSGDTVFFNDQCTDIIHTTTYKPNRMVVFDGDIPHSMKPQSILAPRYRFCLALFFRK